MQERRDKQQARTTTRRGFMKTAALTAAAVFGAPTIVPSSVFGANAPSNRINVGCIGTGNQGFLDMKSFLELDGCQIVTVCDVNTAS